MKRIVYKILYLAAWILGAVFLTGTLGFSSLKTTGITCSEIRVRYAGKQVIRLGEKELVKIARGADPALKDKKLSEIDTEAIERQLAKNKTIRKADAYTIVVHDSSGMRGVLVLKVRHRIPVMRVKSAQDDYYMDKDGNKIPASVRYAARVPLITGNPGLEEARTKLLPFVTFLSDDAFWSAQVKQIHVTANGELLLTTLAGNHLIEFGSPENIREKFRNLKAFYDQVLASDRWNLYYRINLKYQNQIIAKKNK